MHRITIIRDYFFDGHASLGSCVVHDGAGNRLFKGVSLERGWVNNENMISCIPVGTYPVVLEHSPKFEKMLWEIKNVPGRSECKFHVANFWHQLNGCIALGKYEEFIDGDPVMDIKFSGITMKRFHEAMKGAEGSTAELTVVNVLNL